MDSTLSYRLLIINNTDDCVGGDIIVVDKIGNKISPEKSYGANLIVLEPDSLCEINKIISGSKTILTATILSKPISLNPDNSDDSLVISFPNTNKIRIMKREKTNKHPESLFASKFRFGDSNLLLLKEVCYDDFDIILKAMHGDLRAFHENLELMGFLGIKSNSVALEVLSKKLDRSMEVLKEEMYQRITKIDKWLGDSAINYGRPFNNNLPHYGVSCLFAESYLEYESMKQIFNSYNHIIPIQLLFCYSGTKLLNFSIKNSVPMYLSTMLGSQPSVFFGNNYNTTHSENSVTKCESIRHERLQYFFNKIALPTNSKLKSLSEKQMAGSEKEFIDNYILISLAIKKELTISQKKNIRLNQNKGTKEFSNKNDMILITNKLNEMFGTGTCYLELELFFQKCKNEITCTESLPYGDPTKCIYYNTLESYYGFLIIPSMQ